MNSLAINTKKNETLYALKGLSAILIIFIHAPLPGVIGQFIVALARTSVALFFFISGYFMYTTEPTDYKSSSFKKVMHIFKIALISYIFYFLWEILVLITGTGISAAIEWVESIFSLKPWLSFFFLQVDIFAGHLWFLNALIICYIVVWFFRDNLFSKKGSILAILLLLINFVLMNVLPHLTDYIIDMKICRNAWFYGIPVFILGGCLHKYILTAGKEFNNKRLILLGCGSCIMIIFERFFLGYSQLYLGNLFLLFSIFIWAIQNPQVKNLKVLNYLGKNLSLYVYIIQWAMLFVAIKVLKLLKRPNDTILMACFTVVGTIVASWLIYKIILGVRKCRVFQK